MKGYFIYSIYVKGDLINEQKVVASYLEVINIADYKSNTLFGLISADLNVTQNKEFSILKKNNPDIEFDKNQLYPCSTRVYTTKKGQKAINIRLRRTNMSGITEFSPKIIVIGEENVERTTAEYMKFKPVTIECSPINYESSDVATSFFIKYLENN